MAYAFAMVEAIFYSLTFFYWAEVKKIKTYTTLIVLLYLFIDLIEITYLGLSTYRTSFATTLHEILFSFFAIYLFNKILSSHELFSEKRLKLLILVPFLIFYTYLSLIDIFMAFLFSPTTQKVFTNLYWLIKILNPINYLCISLAFYLAPRKQPYLQ